MTAQVPRGPDRRQFIAMGAGAFVVATMPVVARRRDRLVRRALPLMGTIAELAVVHRDERYAQRAMDAALAELQRIERTMTRFDPASEIGRANRLARRDGVAVGAETAHVVREALAWAAATAGAFDPAIGGLVGLWDVQHRHEPPPAERAARLAGRQLHRHVDVGRGADGDLLRFEDADVQLDLGGIAKGYGVDRAAATLRDWGVDHALVNVGGDLYAIGTAHDGEPWQVGIQDPADERGIIGTVAVADGAIATSGTYQQYFRYRGHRYHHLLDPSTGAPRATPQQSLTIRAASCMQADAAATALYGMARDDARRVLATRAPGADIVGTA